MRTIKIEVDEYDLRRLIMKSILPDAQGVELYQALLPANRIILAIRALEAYNLPPDELSKKVDGLTW